MALASPFAIGMTGGSAVADDAPYQCSVGATSPNLRLTAVEKDGACAGFEVRDRSGNLVQSFNGWLGSGLLLSAADGKRVVFVQSLPLAGIGKDGRIRGVVKSESLIGVAIFGDGDRLGSFDLNELVVRPRMVNVSVSHVSWVRRAHIDRRGHPQLVLETTSLRRLTFDLTSARLLSSEDAAEWRRCPMIAYGSVSEKAKRLEAGDLVFAKATGPSTVRLQKTPRTPSSGVYTLCLRPSSGGTMTAEAIPDLTLNALTSP